jgi:hypothetical protein
MESCGGVFSAHEHDGIPGFPRTARSNSPVMWQRYRPAGWQQAQWRTTYIVSSGSQYSRFPEVPRRRPTSPDAPKPDFVVRRATLGSFAKSSQSRSCSSSPRKARRLLRLTHKHRWKAQRATYSEQPPGLFLQFARGPRQKEFEGQFRCNCFSTRGDKVRGGIRQREDSGPRLCRARNGRALESSAVKSTQPIDPDCQQCARGRSSFCALPEDVVGYCARLLTGAAACVSAQQVPGTVQAQDP